MLEGFISVMVSAALAQKAETARKRMIKKASDSKDPLDDATRKDMKAAAYGKSSEKERERHRYGLKTGKESQKGERRKRATPQRDLCVTPSARV